MSTAFDLPGIVMLDMTQEKAFDIVAELDDVQTNKTDSVTVYSGIHKQHGAVHVVVTAIGNPVILPIIVRGVGGLIPLQEPIESPLSPRGDAL